MPNTILPGDVSLWSPDIHSAYANEAVWQTRFMANRVKRLDADVLKKNMLVEIHDITPHLQAVNLGADGALSFSKIPQNVVQLQVTEEPHVAYQIDRRVDFQNLENVQAIHAKAGGEELQEYLERFLIKLHPGLAAAFRTPCTDITKTQLGIAKRKMDRMLVKARNRHFITSVEQQCTMVLTEDFSSVKWQGMGYMGAGMKKGELSDMVLGFEPLYTTLNNDTTVIDHSGDGGVNGAYYTSMVWTDEAIGCAVQKSVMTDGPIKSETHTRVTYWMLSVFGARLIRLASAPWAVAIDHVNP